MIVVSDTSPITNLAAVGLLDLVHQLYGEIVIPPAVYAELTSGGAANPGCVEVQTLSWITVQPVNDLGFVAALLNTFDRGEAEADTPCVSQRHRTSN